MPEINVEQVARDLLTTSKNLDRHIAAKGKEIGDAHGRVYAKAADERIRDKDAELQRAQDLVAELRRQMKPLTRHTYAHCALEKRLNELIEWAKAHEGNVPAEMLFTAIGDARATAHARWEQEQSAARRQTEAADG